jgi:hypothetical protein
LAKIRVDFFTYINKLNDFTVPNLVRKFIDWKNQKVYIKFEDKAGNEHYFLACKRGNSKHLRKIKRKIKLIQDILKKNRINREKSNIAFITLTFDRNKFLNNIYAWYYLSDYVNDYLENLKKKLRKKGNDIEFFIKTYEYHKDYFPHVHIILKLKRPLKTFMYKGKKRFASKRRLFEWNYGFTDAEAPKNVKHTLSYLVKYCVKNYFRNYEEIENVQDTNKEEINGIKLNKNDILLTILWLFRKFTISHTRLRLDYLKMGELTYNENLLTFKGLIIINYPIQFLEFIKEWYKIHELIYFKIHANKKIIEIENDMFSLDKNRVEIDDNHIF